MTRQDRTHRGATWPLWGTPAGRRRCRPSIGAGQPAGKRTGAKAGSADRRARERSRLARSRIRAREDAVSAIKIRGRTFGAARAPPAPEDPDCEEHDECEHHVVDVAEAVVEVVPAASDREADACEREAPDRRTRQREHGVTPDGHPKDTGRDRAERAHEGRETPEKHRSVAPAFEPALRPLQLLGPEMEPASMTFEQRTSSVDPDSPADHSPDRVADGP